MNTIRKATATNPNGLSTTPELAFFTGAPGVATILCRWCAPSNHNLTYVGPVTPKIEAQVFEETGEVVHCDVCGCALPTDLDPDYAPGYDRDPESLAAAESLATTEQLRQMVHLLVDQLVENVEIDAMSDGEGQVAARAASRAAMLRVARVVVREAIDTTVGDAIAMNEYDEMLQADAELGKGMC